MTNSPDEQTETDDIDKSGLEYNIIMELTEWRALSNIVYTDFHGQEEGEDSEFDKFCERERKAYKALLAKAEAWSRQQTAQVLDGLLAFPTEWIMDDHVNLVIPVENIQAAIAALRVGLEGKQIC